MKFSFVYPTQPTNQPIDRLNSDKFSCEIIGQKEYYIKHGEKKNIRRKIYERTEYDDFEKANIAEFKKYLATKGVIIPSR